MKRSELSAPLSVILHITNRCNLRCSHCSASAGEALEQELTTEEWLALIRRLSELKVFKVAVTGGEPLSRPNIFRLLEELDRRRMGIRLNTNATLVDDHVAGRLARLDMLHSVSVSLDGSCAAVHDRLRGPGAFDLAVKGIKALLRQGLNVDIMAIVTAFNLHDLEDLARVAKGLGVPRLSFGALHPTGRARETTSSVWLNGRQRRAAGERLAALVEEYDGFVGSSFPNWLRLLSFPPRPGTQPRPILTCSAAMESCAIRANGDVVPCNSAMDYVCGNLREQDFAGIWRHSPRMQAVRALADLTSDDVEGCRECPYRFSCSTGCRADAWHFSGSWTGSPSAICWYHPD